MSDHERDVLKNEIWIRKPRIVVEAGCWFGGGSTFQIASGLKENAQRGHRGNLYTCDPNIDHATSARHYYHQKFWDGIVQVHDCVFSHLLPWVLKIGKPDFILLDGGEVPEDAMEDMKLIEACVDPGAIFCMHDWLNPESRKQLLIKPYLEQSKRWEIYGLLKPPLSVGFVLARFLG